VTVGLILGPCRAFEVQILGLEFVWISSSDFEFLSGRVGSEIFPSRSRQGGDDNDVSGSPAPAEEPSSAVLQKKMPHDGPGEPGAMAHDLLASALTSWP